MENQREPGVIGSDAYFSSNLLQSKEEYVHSGRSAAISVAGKWKVGQKWAEIYDFSVVGLGRARGELQVSRVAVCAHVETAKNGKFGECAGVVFARAAVGCHEKEKTKKSN